MKIESGKKKEKWNIFGAAAEKTQASLLNGPRIEIFSNNQIVVEGCKGVIEYNENYLKLRLSSYFLVMIGENFDVQSFEENTIFVKGKINSLEFAV